MFLYSYFRGINIIILASHYSVLNVQNKLALEFVIKLSLILIIPRNIPNLIDSLRVCFFFKTFIAIYFFFSYFLDACYKSSHIFYIFIYYNEWQQKSSCYAFIKVTEKHSTQPPNYLQIVDNKLYSLSHATSRK